MPFFGGGGGGGDYKINGTNIEGGTLAIPAIIGDNNMALGNGSLQNAINSDANIAVGNNSLNKQTDALYNVSIGYQSLSEITTGSNNIAIGAYVNKPFFSLGDQSDDINSSVLVGHIVASNRDATDPANHVISGSVAIGAECLGFNATAIRSFIDNVCIGANSQLNINSDISNSVAIGAYTTAASTGVSVGYLTSSANNAIAIGQSVTSVANQIKIGDASHTSVIIGGIDFSGGPGGGSVEGVDAFKITAVSNTSTFSFYGAGVTTVGTLGSMTLSNTNVFRKVPMTSAASAAGAGSGCGIYSTQPTNMFPSAASLSGGFKFNCVVSIDDASGAIGNAGRTFFGLSENVGALTNSNPSSGFGGNNTLGIGSDAGDSTLSIIVYDATNGLLQKTSLGADFPVSAFGVPALWEIELTYDVNPITVSYKVTRKTNTNEYVATGVTVPINTPLVAARPYVWRNNGAVASAVRLNINSCSLKLL